MESPVLVHTRIEKNHRTTIILLALVPLVLVPYAAGVAVWIAPVVAHEAISLGPAAIAFFGLEMTPPWGELRPAARARRGAGPSASGGEPVRRCRPSAAAPLRDRVGGTERVRHRP